MISSSASYPSLATAQQAVYGRIITGCSITITIICTWNILLDSSNAGCKGEIFSLVVMETITENLVIDSYICKFIMSKYYLIFSDAYIQTQRQPPKYVFKKKCSKNMQQTSGRTPMPKCDFNKVAKQLYRQLYWNPISAWVFSCKFAAYSQNTFSLKHLWVAASTNSTKLGLWNMRIQLCIKNMNNFSTIKDFSILFAPIHF